jgi:hypothetical protein
MYKPRYLVFDDSLPAQGLGMTADQFADVLRHPLAAIGVRLIRKRRLGSSSLVDGFQGRGMKRCQYRAMLDVVDRVVAGVVASLSAQELAGHAGLASGITKKALASILIQTGAASDSA